MSRAGDEAAYPLKNELVGSGLTKREYFAGLAMQGYMANKSRPTHFHPSDDAKWCVQIADALIAELAKAKP